MMKNIRIIKKIIVVFLSAALLAGAFSADYSTLDAGSSKSKVLTTEAEIRAAFPESYHAGLLALKKAHPNWKFVAFYTGVEWSEIFTEENELSPGRNLCYYTPSKTADYYKPSSWYSTEITGSFNWAANTWTSYDSGEWYQASKEAVAYSIDPRNFFNEEQIFQFLDSASALDEKSAKKAIAYMFQQNGVDFWLKSGQEANLYDSVTQVENPKYKEWLKSNGSAIIYGDVNEDGEWDVFDIAAMGSHILGKRKLSSKALESADINGDGDVDVFDIAIIGAYILGNRQDVPQRGTSYSGTAPEKTIPSYHYLTYTDAVNQVGTKLKVNQVNLASRLISEHGNAQSQLITGTRAFTLANGKVINGGYYNYYNINASGNSLDEIYTNGLREAYREGWDTRYKALYGGAQKYINSFISRGQTTPYSQKFNLDSSSDRVFWGQYMQNISAPATEAKNLYKAYRAAGILDSSLTFIIPVINNINASNPYPTKDGNPNYKMSYIWAVDRKAVTSGEYTTEELLTMNCIKDFNTDKLNYEFTVPYECENIHFFTGSYAKTSKISLLNDYEEDPGPYDEFTGGTSSSYYLLAVGLSTIKVTCTAENGDSRVYTFTITRQGKPKNAVAEPKDAVSITTDLPENKMTLPEIETILPEETLPEPEVPSESADEEETAAESLEETTDESTEETVTGSSEETITESVEETEEESTKETITDVTEETNNDTEPVTEDVIPLEEYGELHE